MANNLPASNFASAALADGAGAFVLCQMQRSRIIYRSAAHRPRRAPRLGSSDAEDSQPVRHQLAQAA